MEVWNIPEFYSVSRNKYILGIALFSELPDFKSRINRHPAAAVRHRLCFSDSLTWLVAAPEAGTSFVSEGCGGLLQPVANDGDGKARCFEPVEVV